MLTCYYDSRDLSCKTPFGAVKAGQPVRFSIYLPKIYLPSPPVLKLHEIGHWDDPLVVELSPGEADAAGNWYTYTFIPERPVVYLYCFEIRWNGETHFVKRGGDNRAVLDQHAALWQLTVYDPQMRAPSFLREGMMYQIFPDRFHGSGEPKEGVPNDRWLREDWGSLPQWRPNVQGEVTNSDYFGGDLRGIEEKLPYLDSLGVTVIYLNPIFEAHSNHRYNTADYAKVDPLLGTNEDFRRLCKAASRLGISILLDGVFSHTGSDSLYFNKEGRYGQGGAYRQWDSPYREWYQFVEYPHKYNCWWGFPTLPNVEELTPSYLEFICGEQGILRRWMELGAAGFRLDVADELPDGFLDRLHDCVKGHDPDKAVIGEVWEDASNKESYGVRRRYLLGRQLDSVMNYPFKDAVLDYVRHGNGGALYGTVMQILENYPPPAIQSMMNFLSTHDTVRAITALAGAPLMENGREWQEAHHHLSPEEYRQGCRLFSLAMILQFGLPGMPCVYYGDEAGLTGYRDPFNRTCFPWGGENADLVELVRSLGGMRRDYPIFSRASFVPMVFDEDICTFERRHRNTGIFFAVNRSPEPRPLHFPHGYRQSRPLIQCGGYRREEGWLEPCSGVIIVSTE